MQSILPQEKWRRMAASDHNKPPRHSFTVLGRLPGLNEYTSACRTHQQKGARMKREAQQKVELLARYQLRGLQIHNPVKLHYHFYEKDRRRDMDNVSGFARKVIQDALVEVGILENDGWKNIKGSTELFDVDAQCPRIEIEIEEV